MCGRAFNCDVRRFQKKRKHKKARHRLTDDGQGFQGVVQRQEKLEAQAQAQRGGADAVASGACKLKAMLVVLGDG